MARGEGVRKRPKHFGPFARPITMTMTTSLPTALLCGAGIVLAALGLFAAGDIAVVALGLGTVFAGGLLHMAEVWIRLRSQPVSDGSKAGVGG